MVIGERFPTEEEAMKELISHRQIMEEKHGADMVSGGGMDIFQMMMNDRLTDDLRRGIEAAAFLWFRLYDETESLPVELLRFYEWCGKEFYTESEVIDFVLDSE